MNASIYFSIFMKTMMMKIDQRIHPYHRPLQKTRDEMKQDIVIKFSRRVNERMTEEVKTAIAVDASFKSKGKNAIQVSSSDNNSPSQAVPNSSPPN